jgi:hypothetical protein
MLVEVVAEFISSEQVVVLVVLVAVDKVEQKVIIMQQLVPQIVAVVEEVLEMRHLPQPKLADQAL